jgi:hypothetical protein
MSEIDVFKAAVEKPCTVPNWTRLLSEINDSTKPQDRLVIKVFYKVWSGFTKFIRA